VGISPAFLTLLLPLLLFLILPLRVSGKTQNQIHPRGGDARAAKTMAPNESSALQPDARGNRAMKIRPVLILLAVIFSAALTSFVPMHAYMQAQVKARASSKHTITVTFNYDFSKTHSCSATVTKSCVQQFNVYDLSAGFEARQKIFSIPVEPGRTKVVNGITGKSPLLAFEPGRHELGVTAQMAGGSESPVEASTTWVVIPAADKKPSN
jgi:hypothetical protein